jgi:hypothetical protein
MNLAHTPFFCNSADLYPFHSALHEIAKRSRVEMGLPESWIWIAGFRPKIEFGFGFWTEPVEIAKITKLEKREKLVRPRLA